MLELWLIPALIIDGDVMDNMAVKTQTLVKRESQSMGSVKMLLGTDALRVQPMLELLLIPVLIIDGGVMDSMAVKIQVLVIREYPSMGSVKMLLGTDALQVLPMIKLSLMVVTIMHGGVMDNMVVTILLFVTRENLSMGSVIMFVEMHVAQV